MNNRIVTAAQMKSIEKRAAEHFQISEATMMENAGEALFNEIEKRFDSLYEKRVLVLCGSGNNGGDGLVAARYLINRRALVKVLMVNGTHLNDICKKMLDRLPQGIIETELPDEQLDSFDLVIDAVYGTGFHGTLHSDLSALFQKLNKTTAFKIAVDLVSGSVCDSGQTGGTLLHCELTVTFALPKLCHFLFPAAGYRGELIVCDIGIPAAAIEEDQIKTEYTSEQLTKTFLPKRKRDSHKGDYGKLLCICGSRYMTGAAALSTEAAVRSGAGIVQLMVPDEILDILQIKLTEPVFASYNQGSVQGNLMRALEKKDAVLFGCGCSDNNTTLYILKELLLSSLPLVLDADALNLASNHKIPLKRSEPVIVTPHVMEFSRLTGLSIDEIESDRIKVAASYSAKENVITVLKGAYTIIAEPFGRVFLNPYGNAGMAKGGSGDVLAGVIASFLAQGIEPFTAAIAGVYLHSKAGDNAAEKLSQYGMIPSDILNELPLLLKNFDGA